MNQKTCDGDTVTQEINHGGTRRALRMAALGVFMEGLCEQVKRRISHVNTKEKSIQGSENSVCKGPEAGISQTCCE